MGYRPGHTLPRVKRRGALGKGDDSDTVRCAMVGNAFRTLAVSVLVGAMFDSESVRGVYRAPAELQEDLVQELL